MNFKVVEKKFKFWRKVIKRKLDAFTLVELIITIVILAILATIAYSSFLWFSKNARDITRISNIDMMQTSIDLYELKEWKYPIPTNPNRIVYSWALLWSQWTFWDDLFLNVRIINEKPTDVLTSSDYTYSLLNTNRHYELSTVIEWNTNIWINIITKSNAVKQRIARSYSIWTYNWIVVRAYSGSTLYILALPAITVNNLSSLDIVEIVGKKRLSYKWYNNLPESYSGTVLKIDWGFDFDPSILVLYEWSVDNLLYSENEQVNLLKNLQDAYSWTILESNPNLNSIINLDIDTNIASKEVREIAYDFVENVLELEQTIILTSWDEWLTYDISNALLDNDTRSITQDLIWNIWLATKKWVNVFWEWIWLAYDEAYWLADKDTRWVLATLDWNIWFATNKWISKFDWTNWTTYDKWDWISSDDVIDLYQDTDWNIWIATNKWVTKYDWTNFTVYDESDWLIDKEVKSISQSTDWSMWFATIQWISNFDGSNFINYDNTDWLADKNVLSMHAGSNWSMWFWTIDWASNFDWINFTNYNLADWLADKFVQAIYQDSDWNIWFGTKKWANKFNWTTWELYDSSNWLADDDVQVIFQDEVWNMWFGTKKWVTIYFK